MALTYKQSKTTNFLKKINMIIYFFGLPNCWIEDFNLSKQFIKNYDRITMINNSIILIWLVLESGAFFTQNLTKKEFYCHIFFVIGHTTICAYHIILTYQKDTIKLAFYNLSVALKRIHNDLKIERSMIERTEMYIAALSITCILSMLMHTVDVALDMVKNNTTFTAVITAYPDVKNKSKLANIVRVFCYVVWWLFIFRVFATYILVLSQTISLSHQYKNLQSYFYSLNDIFKRRDLSQKQKEKLYEEQFKIGIKLHSDTISCTTQCQNICGAVYSGQILLNLVGILILMVQMVKSEQSLANVSATLLSAAAVLVSTGFIMWNAGDVTVEASVLPTAIYSSGWENCQAQSSIRVRKLVTIAMHHAQFGRAAKSLSPPSRMPLGTSFQYSKPKYTNMPDHQGTVDQIPIIEEKPVVLRGLGYIELSYQSYLRIVKASYSGFSVLA